MLSCRYPVFADLVCRLRGCTGQATSHQSLWLPSPHRFSWAPGGLLEPWPQTEQVCVTTVSHSRRRGEVRAGRRVGREGRGTWTASRRHLGLTARRLEMCTQIFVLRLGRKEREEREVWRGPLGCSCQAGGLSKGHPQGAALVQPTCPQPPALTLLLLLLLSRWSVSSPTICVQ